MKHLLQKELALTLHPTSVLFWALSALLLVPGYPYYVTFFYTGRGIFFTCLNGRENNDVAYTLTLPVAKTDLVKARFLLVLLLEGVQVAVAIPFALLRQRMPVPENPVGMEANLAFFGLSLGLLGLFNFVFLGLYYRDVTKVGTSFTWASVAVFVYIVAAETCAHVIPFVRDRLDTPDPQFLGEKLAVLLLGGAVCAGLTWITYRKSVRNFQRFDLA